jgi:2-polyprenyl-6-methoxyphenol hydroxylase-like FAD-dependent oxidoreductase
MRVVIIGGGIGGLAAAVALHQRGIAVSVYEQADALREQGAGLWLWANAIHVLRRLNLEHEIRRRGSAGNPGQIQAQDGRPLVSLVASEQHAATGHDTMAVHRADLLRVLHAALPPTVVQFGARFLASSEHPGGIVAHFADGRAIDGDVLVGADGLRSAVRVQLWGNAPPRYAGFTAWRAVVPFAHACIVPGVSWGRGGRFGTLPVREGQVNWFAARNAPQGGGDDPATLRAFLLGHFSSWHAPIAELIAATDSLTIIRSDIFDRPPSPRWSQGRTTLLGDAAHPMTPSLGQGACQALEDALVLAEYLSESSDLSGALAAYDARRIPRTGAIQRQSRLLDRLIQLEQPLLCQARDLLLRHMPPALRARRLGAIVDARV